MKKGFKLIVPSFLAIIVCVLLLAGSTFALFTSDVTTNVSVNSATVNVEASLAITKLYSVVPTDNETGTAGSAIAFGVTSQYDYEEQTGTFKTKGTATILENGTLKLENMVPGDRVDFKLNVTNKSNVDIKYRLSVNASGDAPLLAANELTIAGVKHTGLSTYKSAWTFAAASSTIFTNGLDFSLVLPVATGNTVQKKSAAYNVVLEAVQANAKTEGNEEITLADTKITKFEDASDEATVENLEDTSLKAEISSSDYFVQLDIPAENLATNDNLELNVSGLTITDVIGSDQSSIALDIVLKKNDQVISSVTEPILVTIFLGGGLDITKVKHKGVEVTSYDYDAGTGYLTFETSSFSPFEVEYTSLDFGFNKSYTKGTGTEKHWVHEIINKNQFRNILTHISSRSSLEKYGANVADANTEYRIMNDIDFGGSLWDASNLDDRATLQTSFTGKLIGNGNSQVVLQNIHVSETITVLRDTNIIALFGKLDNAYFENIKLHNMSITGEGKYVGLFGSANKNDLNHWSSIKFNNCKIDKTCSIICTSGAAFIGEVHYINDIRFINCVNEADVTCTSSNTGAFLGISTDKVANENNTLLFDGCSNSGSVTGTFNCGSFAGYVANMNTSIINSSNTGNVYFNSPCNNSGVFIGKIHSSLTSNYSITINAVNSGKIYVAPVANKTKEDLFVINDEYCEYDLLSAGGNNPKVNLLIRDELSTQITSSNYFDKFVEFSNVGKILLSFDENNTLCGVLDDTSIEYTSVVVKIRQHGLTINKTEYWMYTGEVVNVTSENFETYKASGNLYIRTGSPIEAVYWRPNQFALVGPDDEFNENATYVTNLIFTNEQDGALNSETDAYVVVPNNSFENLSSINIKKVTECGYFIPADANNPQASYGAGFEKFLLNSSLLGTDGYEEGYHIDGNHAYIVITNSDSNATKYLAVCEWRNRVIYEVTAYNGNLIVATGTIAWGQNSNDTYLEPISFK